MMRYDEIYNEAYSMRVYVKDLSMEEVMKRWPFSGFFSRSQALFFLIALFLPFC